MAKDLRKKGFGWFTLFDNEVCVEKKIYGFIDEFEMLFFETNEKTKERKKKVYNLNRLKRWEVFDAKPKEILY